MRILRLVESGDWMIEFHPYVSVVVELDAVRRQKIIDVCRTIATGTAPPVDGLLEGHGVVLDLSAESLEVLEVDKNAVDIVITPTSLPEAVAAPATRERRSAERRLALLTEPLNLARRHVEDRRADIRGAEEALQQARQRLSAREVQQQSIGAKRAEVEELEARAGEISAAEAQAGIAVASASERLDDLRATVTQREAEVARARETVEAAESALADVEAQAAAAADEAHEAAAARRGAADEHAAQRQQLEEEIEALERERSEVEASRDPEAADALRAATAALADHDAATPELADVAETEPEPESEPEAEHEPQVDTEETVEAELTRLRDEAELTRAELALAASYEPDAVESALAAALVDPGAIRDADLALASEIDDLADQIDRIDEQLEELARAETDAVAELAEAAARVEDAERRLALLQEEARTPLISEEERAAIERVHAEVEAAEERVESRRGRGKDEMQLQDARAAERELLESLGFQSYMDYLTGSPMAATSSAMLDKIATANTAARDARLELERLEQNSDLTTVRELRARRQELHEKAEQLIDRSDAPTGLTADPVAALGDALARAGLPVAGLDLDREELVELARDWLEMHVESRDDLDAREARLADLDARIDQLTESLQESSPTDAPATSTPDLGTPTEPGPASEPDAARAALVAAVDAADARSRADDAASARLAAIADELDGLTEARDRLVADAPAPLDEESDALDVTGEFDDAISACRDTLTTAEESLASAEQELAAAKEALDRASEEVDGLIAERDSYLAAAAAHDQRVDSARAELAAFDEGDEADLAAEVRDAEEALRTAQDAHAAAVAVVAGHEARVAEQQQTVDEMGADVPDGEVPPEEIEWFVLERLAAHRDVIFGGSMPLVIDGVVDDLDDAALERVLDRLSRLAGAVQVILVSSDDRVAAWAERAGDQRAMVVQAQLASAA